MRRTAPSLRRLASDAGFRLFEDIADHEAGAKQTWTRAQMRAVTSAEGGRTIQLLMGFQHLSNALDLFGGLEVVRKQYLVNMAEGDLTPLLAQSAQGVPAVRDPKTGFQAAQPISKATEPQIQRRSVPGTVIPGDTRWLPVDNDRYAILRAPLIGRAADLAALAEVNAAQTGDLMVVRTLYPPQAGYSTRVQPYTADPILTRAVIGNAGDIVWPDLAEEAPRFPPGALQWIVQQGRDIAPAHYVRLPELGPLASLGAAPGVGGDSWLRQLPLTVSEHLTFSGPEIHFVRVGPGSRLEVPSVAMGAMWFSMLKDTGLVDAQTRQKLALRQMSLGLTSLRRPRPEAPGNSSLV